MSKIKHDVQGVYDSTKVCNLSFTMDAAGAVAISGSREVASIARESAGTYRLDLASGSYHGQFISAIGGVDNQTFGPGHQVSVAPINSGTAVSQYRVVCAGSGSASDILGATSPRVSVQIWYRATNRSL